MNMKFGYEQQSVEISCMFINHYMASCPAVYSLVYIYSMKCLSLGEDITISTLADKFNITEGDVLNAWKHWENVGIVELANISKDTTITFLPVGMPKANSTEEVISIPTRTNLIATTRPQYTVNELAGYRQQSTEVDRLFSCAEQALGKLLYYNDMSVIFGFHDWLRLPLEVIEFLFDYCAQNGHRNLRYIEKCALDWADNNITNLESAQEYVKRFDKNYREILHYMGQTNAYPAASHRKYIDKWLGADSWNMPIDLVFEACDRCVAQIDKPKFNYVDKILAEWHKNNIRDIEGIKLADAKFAKTKEKADVISIDRYEKKPIKSKTNRFVNFNQRENDYSKYEQLERAYLEQKLQ